MAVSASFPTKVMGITGLLTLLIQDCYHNQGHGTSLGYENERQPRRDW